MSIAPVLAETSPTRNRTPKSKAEKPIAASKVLQTIEQHVLLDGFKIVWISRKAAARTCTTRSMVAD
jgi:hypothetical protein